MIDICIINYKNYFLLDKQIEHWNNYMKGDYRLIIADNTPIAERKYREGVIPFNSSSTFDGISSGEAYDFLAKQAKTDIIGFVDPDFFFGDFNVLYEVEDLFKQGYKCVGAAGFYPDWQRIIDINYPLFAGNLAPVIWSMFIDRELALSETFVCEPPGVGKSTGWRVRKKIIDQKIPNIVWPGFFPFPEDTEICAFGSIEKPKGVHLLKGCSSRAHLMPALVPKVLSYLKGKWQ